MDLCNFSEFSNKISAKGAGPITSTPLRTSQPLLYCISTVTWTADGTHTHTQTYIHKHGRSGHGNRLIMVVLVCSGITWPNLLSTTSVYLI